SSHTATTCPSRSVAIDSHPRLPAASPLGTGAVRPNDFPLSSDLAWSNRVPLAALEVHTTTSDGSRPFLGTSETRGGCSPERRASPITSFTRTGPPKVRPAFRLMATNTSVGPSLPAAPQATATNWPAAAIDGFALARPFTATVASPTFVGSIEPAPLAATAAATTMSETPSLRVTLIKLL